MTAVAEKQVKSSQPQRRALTRAMAMWSRVTAPAPQHGVLREIVAVPQVQKACAGCGSDEMKIERLAFEAGEEEDREQRVQRDNEPGFAAAAAEDEDEWRPRRGVPARRPGAPISVGAADDEHEREADAVADRLGRTPAPMHEPKRDEDEARAKALRGKRGGAGREGGDIDDPELTARLDAPTGGRPLSSALRASVAPLLAYDFSEVRVHDTADDRRDAARLNARAFTYGRHIWIGPGESAENPKLMAHELTHVVQQGGARSAVQRQDAEPGLLDTVIGAPGRFIADQAMGWLRGHAPGLARVLERGPLNWLKDQLMRAFDGVVRVLNRLNPAAALAQLTSVFEGLIARAEPIVAALRAGNCEPLFQAIAELKNFVTELAGTAWDKLTDFVRPIGNFFTDLWAGYGAPAVQWLQETAGEVWDAIRQFGADIWEWTRPVREAVTGAFASAWGWIKEQLFGPQEETSGDSEGGIVGWVTRKATEAWEEIKNLTRPVWQPVVQAAERIRELIPPPFIRRLGEQFRDLSASLNQVNQEASGGDDVAENRAALAAALPTVQEVIAGVRGLIVTGGSWLREKVNALTGDLLALLGRLRGHALLAPLGTLLGWLDGAARDLGAWAHEKVTALFDSVLGAFDVLTPFVQRLVTVVRNVISVVGDLLQLPSLILNAVWNLIPECIRNPIRDFLVNQILSRIPVFSTLLELPDIWARIEATALRILRQVFVDGNLARAAWTFFSSILEVLGIPPQLVVGILAKAASAIGDILANPVGFLLNLLSAIKEGFIRFFDNIWTHLLGGVTGWLFGQLSRAGLQPPQDFSLGSILGFVMQVLDITVERVFERLARRLDPAIVQRLRQALSIATGVWRFVAILIEEGPAGLWREIQEQLGGLWNKVLDAVIGWISRTVIARVSARLLTLLDPTGVMAVVNSLIALYRAIQSAIEYLREMLQIVDRVLDGITGIARGAIDIAAGFFETALASGLPVAIGFLANQIGLRNLGERIQEMVEGVRAMVDRAIDWLIDRAIRAGQALINMLRRGVAAVRNWWAARKQFTSEEGEPHTIYFEGTGTGARVMIQSEPKTYREFIENVAVSPQKQRAKEEAVEIARRLDQAVARAPAAPGMEAGAAPGADPSAEINGLLDELAAATARFIPRRSGASSAPIYGPPVNGFGSSVRVGRLTDDHAEGSTPTDAAGGLTWETLLRRRYGRGSYYVRGHLLNNHLGGPGDQWANLTPLTQIANNRGKLSMSRVFEEPAKRLVEQGNKAYYFAVTAHYGGSHPLAGKIASLGATGNPRDAIVASIIRAEQYIPTSVDCAMHEATAGGQPGAVAEGPVAIDNAIDAHSDADYQVTDEPVVDEKFYVDQKAQLPEAQAITELTRLQGVNATIARAIVRGRPPGGYRRIAQLEDKGLDWSQATGTRRLLVRIYAMSDL